MNWNSWLGGFGFALNGFALTYDLLNGIGWFTLIAIVGLTFSGAALRKST